MMESLFDRIDAISVTSSTLPETDQKAIDRLDALYQNQLADLANARTTLEGLSASSNWLEEKRVQLLEEIKRARANARNEQLQDVICYFNSTHDLGLTIPSKWNEQTDKVADDQLTSFVTGWVISQLGGKSFLNIATEKLAEEFSRMAWRVRRNRRYVTLPGYVYVEDGFRGDKRLSYQSRDKLMLLAKALGRFEASNTDAPWFLQKVFVDICGWSDDATPFGDTIHTHLLKTKEVVIYKNGNIRLAFNNEAEANAFTGFYNLQLAD